MLITAAKSFFVSILRRAKSPFAAKNRQLIQNSGEVLIVQIAAIVKKISKFPIYRPDLAAEPEFFLLKDT